MHTSPPRKFSECAARFLIRPGKGSKKLAHYKRAASKSGKEHSVLLHLLSRVGNSLKFLTFLFFDFYIKAKILILNRS